MPRHTMARDMFSTFIFFLLPILCMAVATPTPTTTATSADINCSEHLNCQHNGTTTTQMGDCTTRISDLGGISSRDAKRSAIAARLSMLVYTPREKVVSDGDGDGDGDGDRHSHNNTVEIPHGLYYESGVDAVFVARVGDEYCAAAFRGTASDQPGDWWTNLVMGAAPFPNKDHCDVHRGYHDAYTEFEHRHTVENFLHDCRIDCPTCEVLLTGHSQGGGIAEIAGLYYLQDTVADNDGQPERTTKGTTNTTNTTTHQNRPPPYVITFGGVQSLGAGCSQLLSRAQRCRWYHNIMTKEGPLGRELVYDPVPFLASTFLDPPDDDDKKLPSVGSSYARNGGVAFVGHEIILSEADPSAAVYVGFDRHHYIDFSKTDMTGGAHLYVLYASVLEQQASLFETAAATDEEEEDGKLFPATGFSEGTICNPDENLCVEGTVCEPEDGKWYLLGFNWRCICRKQLQYDETQMKNASGTFGLTPESFIGLPLSLLTWWSMLGILLL